MKDGPRFVPPVPRTPAPAETGALWQPDLALPLPQVRPAEIPIEAEMLAVLATPLLAGETALQGNARREAELVTLFERLTPIEALFLVKRLANPRPDDALAASFGRLVVERRARLLDFLANTRRRAAQRAARRR